MIRPVLTELALFFAPFAAYALFLWVTRSGVAERSSWPLKRVMTLAIASMLLVIVSFFFLARSPAPPGATYEPAEIGKDGRVVPGRIR